MNITIIFKDGSKREYVYIDDYFIKGDFFVLNRDDPVEKDGFIHSPCTIYISKAEIKEFSVVVGD